MFMIPGVVPLLLLAVVGLTWMVVRFERAALTRFLALALMVGVAFWFSCGNTLSYSVNTYVNDRLVSSYEEGYRPGFRIFVTAAIAVTSGALITLLVGVSESPCQ